MNVESTPSSRVWALADTTVAREDGGWEDTGQRLPMPVSSWGSIIWSHRLHQHCPEKLVLWDAPALWWPGYPARTEGSKPKCWFTSQQPGKPPCMYSFTLCCWLAGQKTKGKTNLIKIWFRHFWVSSRQSCGFLFTVFRSLGADTVNMLCPLATTCLTQAESKKRRRNRMTPTTVNFWFKLKMILK